MTDTEIIKALEICADDEKPCDGCVFHRDNFCGTDLEKAALDLIKRQQERMDEVVKSLESQIDGYKEYYPEDYIFEIYDMIDLCESIIKMIKGDVNDR